MSAREKREGAKDIPVRRKRQRYASSTIHERRKRILSVAQELIVENGETGFTILELSRRAKVAPRTLYNAFGDKEGIIARALEEHYTGRFRSPQYWRKPVTLKNLSLSMDKSVEYVLSTREYARSMTALYFSSNANERVYLALKHVASLVIRVWIEEAKKKKWLEPWCPVEHVITSYANVFMASAHDWLIGRIADEDFAKHVKTDLLLAISAVTKPAQRAQIARLLAE